MTREQVRGVAGLIAVFGASVAFGLGMGAFLTRSLPPPKPAEVTDVYAVRDQEQATWTPHVALEVKEMCGQFYVTREFQVQLDTLGAIESRYIEPAATGPGTQPGAMVSTHLPAGSYPDLHISYPIHWGWRGIYIVRLAASGCPSGFNGISNLFVLPFDWTAGVPRAR